MADPTQNPGHQQGPFSDLPITPQGENSAQSNKLNRAPDQTVTDTNRLAASSPVGRPAAYNPGAPPRGRHWLLPWLSLGLCLLLALVPMLVDLAKAQVVSANELASIKMSTDTWKQQRLMADQQWTLHAWVPCLEEHSRFDQPPGTVWLHLLSFSTLKADASSQLLVYRARLVSVGSGLLIVASVFWAGMSIGSLVTASLAALVCVANPTLMYHSRLATETMPMVALTMFSIGAALWASRPLKPIASVGRQASGWMLCGLAGGLTVLTGGPMAAVAVFVPLLAILLLCPHRVSHLLGLMASLFIAVLLIAPWALFAIGQDPDVARRWLSSEVPQWSGPVVWIAGGRLLLIAAAVLPWTLWLIGGIVQPMSASSKGARQRMFIGWVWLSTITVLLMIGPGRGSLDEVVLAVPVAAILIGQLFRQLADRSAEGRHTRVWRLLRWPHVVVWLTASLTVPLLLNFQTTLVRYQWLWRDLVQPMPWFYWTGLGVILIVLALMSLRYAVHHYPARAMVCWSVWMVTAMGVLMVPVARGPLVHPLFERLGPVSVVSNQKTALPVVMNRHCHNNKAKSLASDTQSRIFATRLVYSPIRTNTVEGGN